MISMSTFLSVRALHEERVPKKMIARRLGIDVRTVRSHIRLIDRGASEPRRAAVSKKLDGFLEVIEAKTAQGLSAVQIYQDLCTRLTSTRATRRSSARCAPCGVSSPRSTAA